MKRNAPLTIMVVAGEHSGDALGAALITELRKKYPTMRVVGVGGNEMIAQGLESVFPMEDLSLMGFTEVIPALPKLFRYARQLVEVALDEKAHLLLTIDAPDFNLRLAKRMKQAKKNIPCIHYVSPTVWAWRKGRVFDMANYLDHVLAIYPFEPSYYSPAGLPCTYVGNPVWERLAAYTPFEVTPPEGLKVAILPGSRVQEWEHHAPLFVSAFERLKQHLPALIAVVPLPDETFVPLYQQYFGHLSGVEAAVGAKRYPALIKCRAAMVKSGTSTLELAVLGVPMAVVYRTGWLNAAIMRLLMRVPYISMANWVAERASVPELIQEKATSENIAQTLWPLLTTNTAWHTQAAALVRIRNKLAQSHHPSQKAAAVVERYF